MPEPVKVVDPGVQAHASRRLIARCAFRGPLLAQSGTRRWRLSCPLSNSTQPPPTRQQMTQSSEKNTDLWKENCPVGPGETPKRLPDDPTPFARYQAGPQVDQFTFFESAPVKIAIRSDPHHGRTSISCSSRSATIALANVVEDTTLCKAPWNLQCPSGVGFRASQLWTCACSSSSAWGQRTGRLGELAPLRLFSLHRFSNECKRRRPSISLLVWR
jgi:hypothetical protein